MAAVKHKKRRDQSEQSARFVEAAKKAEVDERPEEFDKAFAKVAKAKEPVKKKSI